MFNKEKFLVFLKKTKKKFKENKIELHPPRIKKDDYTSIKKCLNTNYISTYGPFVNIFEKKIKNITKSKFVVAVNSGTSGIHLALLSLGVDKGD